MKVYLTILIIVAFSSIKAQVDTFFIDPINTDPGYEFDEDPHMVAINNQENNDRLFLFLGGTRAVTRSYRTITQFVAGLGFDVINLSYKNEVPAALLANDPDRFVFNKFREEVCYGTSQSDDVEVDTLNSIYLRTVRLLNYLKDNLPSRNWDQYFLDGSSILDWSKIAVGGHSQGAGHACYFGKVNAVERVLMFSGPNDFSTFYDESAPWLSLPGATNVNRQFAYLSVLDEVVDFEKQFSNLESLGLYPTYDTTFVDVISNPFENSRCLYTRQQPGFALRHHNTPVKNSGINEEVWTYMLDSIIMSNSSTYEKLDEIEIFPNPTHQLIQIHGLDKGSLYQIFNLNGQVIQEGMTVDNQSIDVKALRQGLYIMVINQKMLKFVKLP